MNGNKKSTRLVLAAVILGGCASTSTTPVVESTARPSPQADFERDREAILSMAGEYKVRFQFMETASLRDGYKLKDPYFADATEFVKVIEDTGRVIDLQHILVMNDPDEPDQKQVVKHWRQTWTYEDDTIYEFQGERTWKPRTLQSTEYVGAWTQTVYQVDDSPRYEGVGRWKHRENFSSWESNETWRPLPRREFSKRNDYNVLVARNRHTITPQGWIHEQDNYKLDLKAEKQPIIALEVGLNIYERTDEFDFSKGYDYWEKTKKYWSDVRSAWAEAMNGSKTIRMEKTVDDKVLWEHIFALAQNVHDEGYQADKNRSLVQERIDSFLVDGQR